MTASPRYTELLDRARQHFDVPKATSIDEVVALLGSWGATSVPVGTHEANLFDEYVDEALVVHQARIDDAQFIAAHKLDGDDDGYDPQEWDEEPDAGKGDDEGDSDGWGEIADQLEAAQLVIIILERDRRHPNQVGNFRVHGAGQWFREALWAATGVIPRDPGGAGSDLFAHAVDLLRPERPDLPIALYDRLPGRVWNLYVTLRRPGWRRARRRFVRARDA